MILIIDNYDSFTYNLVQAIGRTGEAREIQVVLNDQVTLGEIERCHPTHIIISPGPCTPNESGISLDLIRAFAGKIPILGVCLGHQCIGKVYGALVTRAMRLMHGKVSQIYHCGTGIYHGLLNPFTAARYHSLIIDPSTLPKGFEVTAWTDRDEPMGIRHGPLALEGVQFHPESFLTPLGFQLLENFIALHSNIIPHTAARV